MKRIPPRILFGVLCAIFIVAAYSVFGKSNKQTIKVSSTDNSAAIQDTTQATVAVNQNTTISPDTTLKSPTPIAILMYHYIRDLNDPTDQIGTNLSVSPAVFSSEISKFKADGYSTASFNEYLAGKTSSKSLILTFDDGYDDAFLAYQILKQNNFIGVFYIITGRIDTPGYLSTNQIKEMSDGGMIIGSHTVSHPDLSTAPITATNKELVESKSRLESITGKPVVDFCYPSGKYNTETISAVSAAGYKYAVTTAGANLKNFTSFFELPRIRVNNTDTPSGLVSHIKQLSNE